MLEILEEVYVEGGQESVDEITVPTVEAGVINTQFRPKSSFYPHWNTGNSKLTFYEVPMLNYFSFMSSHYRQAMGTRFGPSYDNLFMGYWELKHIWANNPYWGNLGLYAC